jgi:hypothetical protein
VSPVKYELGFYIPEDDILHSHRRESLKFYQNSFRGVENSGRGYTDLLIVRLFLLSDAFLPSVTP